MGALRRQPGRRDDDRHGGCRHDDGGGRDDDGSGRDGLAAPGLDARGGAPARFHDARAADAAEQDFVNRSKGGIPDEIPEVRLSGAPLGIAVLLKQAGLAPSTSEANRLVDGGGVRVDSAAVSDKGLKLAAGTYVVQVGKRKFARVTLA